MKKNLEGGASTRRKDKALDFGGREGLGASWMQKKR